MFDYFDLTITNSESSAFFRFCAAIFESFDHDRSFGRGEPFGRIVRDMKRYREIRAEQWEAEERVLFIHDTAELEDGSPEEQEIVALETRARDLEEEMEELARRYDLIQLARSPLEERLARNLAP